MKTQTPLGGTRVADFMRRHWQRRALMIRGAIPGFADPLSPRDVLALATDADAQSRLVRRKGTSWTLEHGPFTGSRFKQLPRRDWTVLVQDTNHFSARADALLRRFAFIPHARIDDVMVSYAVPGGTVGPHVDSYDVFLLQGHGRRRWQVSRQRDHSFVAGLPLRILERFEPDDEWVMEAGDMLYLPPNVAHYGVAESACLTWSIGFRAPSDAELVAGFLDYLHEKLSPEGQYADPGAGAPRHAAEVPASMLQHVSRALAKVRWTEADAQEFAGRFLSEPKSEAYFPPPAHPLSRKAFEARAARRGLLLDRKSRLLFSGRIFFMNGETRMIPAPARAMVRRLANERALPAPLQAASAFWDVAHEWYLQGLVHLPAEAA